MQRTLVFGYAASGISRAAREHMARLVAEVSRQSTVRLALYEADSYEALGRAVHSDEVQLAWLPPIPFVALDRRSAVVPLVSSMRGGGQRFESVIIVNRSSMFRRLRELQGTNAAWVDPYSASGYVFPRIELAAAGVDVRFFESEMFLDSHDEVVRAVACHEADFGATYATVGKSGEILRAAWLDIPEIADGIRVLAHVGSLPADVIGARADVDKLTQSRLTRAFVTMSRDPQNRMLMLEVFGADELRASVPSGYDLVRSETERASSLGLL